MSCRSKQDDGGARRSRYGSGQLRVARSFRLQTPQCTDMSRGVLLRTLFGCLAVCLRRWPLLALLSVYLVRPCAGRHLLSLPAAKKVGKESGLQPLALRCPFGHQPGTAQDETCSRTTHVSDKAVIRSSVALRAPPSGTSPSGQLHLPEAPTIVPYKARSDQITFSRSHAEARSIAVTTTITMISTAAVDA
jgi:hypothetical protein